MAKIKLGLVTAWGECGMGYLAKNWVYTFDKYPDKIDYQIYSRAYPWLSPFRWHGPKIVDGPEQMEIDHPHFWKWVDSYKPDVILLYDANLSHVKRNHKWLEDAKLENPTLIQWGVILKNFPFVKRKV